MGVGFGVLLGVGVGLALGDGLWLAAGLVLGCVVALDDELVVAAGDALFFPVAHADFPQVLLPIIVVRVDVSPKLDACTLGIGWRIGRDEIDRCAVG